MSPEERAAITSNDYFDLIIDYNADRSLLKPFENAVINYINLRYAIVHVPVETVPNYITIDVGYAAFPHCFGLTSTLSLEVSGVLRARNTAGLNLLGTGTLIGIIDTGIDYTNPIFKNIDGSSRIEAIWDQSIESDQFPEGFNYGTEYRKPLINFALLSGNPYSIVPSVDEIGHGTMLAGVAGGNIDLANQFSGVAPAAEFVIVKLKQAKSVIMDLYAIPPDVPCYQENDIMFAIKYMEHISNQLRRPIAFCIGLGSSQGAHNGTEPVEGYLSMVSRNNGVASIVSAGNEGSGRRHFYGRVNPRIGYEEVEVNVAENESGFTMELWGDVPGVFSVNILSPSGEFIPRIPARLFETREISFIMEATRITINNVLIEAISGEQLIRMEFRNPASGIWRFQVFNSSNFDAGFNIWLPMVNFISEDTYFLRGSPETTILSPGNADVPITITAYDPSNNSLYSNASRGFTRAGDTIIVPSVAAPGVNITVPTLDQGFASGTGTGIAAAHTAGIAALLLEWGVVRGNYSRLNTIGIKELLIKGARRNPNIIYPNRDWGYGIVDLFNIFTSLRSET